MTVTIHVNGLKEIQTALGDSGDNILQAVALGVGEGVKEEAQVYPARKHVPMQFVSEKQRRWFFWALRTGRIQVPYQRTYMLKNAWAVKRRGSTGAVVDNETPHAGYVHGEREQTKMMAAIGWRKVDRIAKDAERGGKLQAVAERALEGILSKLGLR